MTNYEYKVVTAQIVIDSLVYGRRAQKKLEDLFTERANKIGEEYGSQGWELLNIFPMPAGVYGFTLRRALR